MSEAEVKAENDYMSRFRGNVAMYVTVHSFGDMLLYPWSYQGSTGKIANWQTHETIGNLYANAIRAVNGKSILVANSIEVFGYISGSSDDHMAGEQRAPISFTTELTRGGITGFDFPESGLEALVQETFHGYRAWARHTWQ